MHKEEFTLHKSKFSRPEDLDRASVGKHLKAIGFVKNRVEAGYTDWMHPNGTSATVGADGRVEFHSRVPSGGWGTEFDRPGSWTPNPLTASEASELQRLARISNVFANQHLAGALPVQAAFSYGHSSGVMEAATALAPEDAQLREAAIANYKRVHDGLDEAGRVAFKLREKLPVGKIRTPNPLSVLVLGNDPERAQNGCAPVMRPRRSQNPAPPAGTLGLKEVLAHNEEFHGAPVGRWIHVQIPDGSDQVTRKAFSGLGLVDASVYSVPDRASNKHGEVWEHVHERKKPLEVYDPISHTTIKVLEPGTGPSDWWRDNVGPQGPWRRP
jgi:hypothetical protein